MNLIKEILEAKGKSQGWLSKNSGVSRPHLNRIVNNKIDPSLLTAKKIAKVLGCNVETIWPH